MRPGSRLDGATLLAIFDAQIESRQLDLTARWMQQQGRGFYTIGSAGHEGNAAVAAALRPTDPALLHYRSGGFYCARAHQVSGIDPVRDVLLGVAASADEPIAGGRHKVIGRAELAVIPQTSTIASHLPRALGVALGIGRAAKLGVPCPWPRDAVAVVSFGDASASHSTAVGAINAACHTAYQGIPVPLLLVCEDNGLGISVPTPQGWVAAAYRDRPGLSYLAADGCDPVAAYDAAIDRGPAGAVPAPPRVPAPVHGPLTWATRAATRRRPTARPRPWPPTWTATRWWPPRPRWSAPGCSPRTRPWRGTARPGSGSVAWPSRPCPAGR